jgi:hypothetical protein
MIRNLKLSDKILFSTVAGTFVAMTLFLIWLRLNWETYLGWLVSQ